MEYKQLNWYLFDISNNNYIKDYVSNNYVSFNDNIDKFIFNIKYFNELDLIKSYTSKKFNDIQYYVEYYYKVKDKLYYENKITLKNYIICPIFNNNYYDEESKFNSTIIHVGIFSLDPIIFKINNNLKYTKYSFICDLLFNSYFDNNKTSYLINIFNCAYNSALIINNKTNIELKLYDDDSIYYIDFIKIFEYAKSYWKTWELYINSTYFNKLIKKTNNKIKNIKMLTNCENNNLSSKHSKKKNKKIDKLLFKETLNKEESLLHEFNNIKL